LMAIDLCDVNSFMYMKEFMNDVELYDILKNIKNRDKIFDEIFEVIKHNLL